MNNLLARWGAPAWNRLKSCDYPDRYVVLDPNDGSGAFKADATLLLTR